MLERLFSRHAHRAYALLRFVSGLAFAFHGAQKVLGFHSGSTPPLGSQLWFGGMIELVGGVLIAIGLWTHWAAFIASGTMAVAYIQFHWQGRLDEKFFPALNKGELSLLYCFVFLYIACRGSVAYGVDNKRR